MSRGETISNRRRQARIVLAPGWFPRWLKPMVFAAAMVPVVRLVVLAMTGGLGVNPIEATTRYLGDWALTMLLVALAVTPVRRLTGWSAVMRLRRMLGLFAFFYAMLHVLSYVGLDQFFAWEIIWSDVVKRKYITAGVAAFLILVALAATSPRAAVKRLGAARWRRLHRLVYLAGALSVLHYFWMVKADLSQPIIYAASLVLLLAARLPSRTQPGRSGK